MSRADFPREYAQTRRFTLGVPSAFRCAPDRRRVVYLRSRSGRDPAGCLWQLDLVSGRETLVADPGELLGLAPGAPLPPAIQRQLVQAPGWGIRSYSTDQAVRRACFTIAGRLWVAELDGADGPGPVREIALPGRAADARLDPGGTRVAYAAGGSVRVVRLGGGDGARGGADGSERGGLNGERTRGDGARGGAGDAAAESGDDWELAGPDGEDVAFGLMGDGPKSWQLDRGHWWAPDGSALLVTRVDASRVQRYWLADPTDPGAAPVALRYPRVGTANPDVSLWVVGLDGSRVEVQWDRAAWEYLVAVSWDAAGPLIAVQLRDQRRERVLAVNPATGDTEVRFEDADPAWITIVPGVPRYTASGRLIWACDRDGARRLIVDGEPVTPDGLQLREVLDVDGDIVLFTASAEQTESQLWAWDATGGGLELVAGGSGVFSGARGSGMTVVVRQSLGSDGADVVVRGAGQEGAGGAGLEGAGGAGPGSAGGAGEVGAWGAAGELRVPTDRVRSEVGLRIELLRAGAREIRTALLLPSWYADGGEPLPVLLCPYGGAAQRVLAAPTSWYYEDQWFAEHGFAVIVADGRGTPGRDPDWERATRGDIATPVLEDQVAALEAMAVRYPGLLDHSRVGIRGGSFAGFLSALAVLRRPDVFRAAVARAPVTDQRLYSSHFKERYLGHPDEEPGNYDHCSLLADAPNLRRPLLLIHGLADENVVPAHTLRLSAALLAAGRPHEVVLQPGLGHRVFDETATEQLMWLELEFLTRELGVAQARPAATSAASRG